MITDELKGCLSINFINNYKPNKIVILIIYNYR